MMINAHLMTFPYPVFRKRPFPEQYFIKQRNDIVFQNYIECAAFSSAYLLRHFGLKADGFSLYKQFPNKTRKGTIYPKGIRKVFKDRGFITHFYKGSIATLKHELTKGTPVIVFIKERKEKNFLHYVPVVGYDTEYIYLAESINYLANYEDRDNSYNRRVAISEFKQLWNIKRIYMPFHSNTYITVKKHTEK